MKIKPKIMITLFLFSGIILIIAGIFEKNIYEIMLGIMFIIEILNIQNERRSDKIIKLQNDIIKTNTHSFLLLCSATKPYIKENEKLNKLLNKYIIILNEREGLIDDSK